MPRAKIRLIGLLLVLSVLPAHAQNVFPTPTGPTTVMTVEGCLNASGFAVPASEGTCVLLAPPVTPAAFSGLYAIASGGVAQQLAAAGEVKNNCVVLNPTSATQQSIGSAESLFINFVTTATVAAGGTSIELLPGQAVGCPGGSLLAISVNAATTGHRFSGYRD